MKKPVKKPKKPLPKKADKKRTVVDDSLMSELLQSQYQEISKTKKKK